MLERLAGKALSRFLSKYFEDDERTRQKQTSFYSAVWSGYLSLRDLRLRVSHINAQLQAAGLPIEVVHCSIKKVEMTIPWSRWTVLSVGRTASTTTANNNAPGRDSAVLVLDGVHVLVRMKCDSDETDSNDNLVKERAVKKRRKTLEEAVIDIASAGSSAGTSRTSWKELLQQKLQEGILPALMDCLQLHLRDLHIRFEDDSEDEPFAVGLVLESMHIQHDLEATATSMDASEKSSSNGESTPAVIHKVAELNRLGVYWSALERDDESSVLPKDRVEQKILSKRTPTEIIRALDQTINRRSVETTTMMQSTRQSRAPQHTYLLQPVDGQCHAAVSANPNCLKYQPAVTAVCTVADVSFQIRDFQCLQMIRLVHNVKEYKYSQRHRRYRPACTVREDPRAWWLYAVNAIRHELIERLPMRWSWGRFRQRFAARKRYCDLYERRLRTTSPDDAAGPGPTIPHNGQSLPLTEAEKIELAEMEDGVAGDLSVQDILLFRILVNKRIGSKPSLDESGSARSSWFRRKYQSLVGEEVEDDEYHRLLAYWQNWSASIEEASNRGHESNETVFAVAVSVKLLVERGQLSLFSPLGSTADQPQLRRLQERFLDFTYTGFVVGFSLLGDYESLAVDVSLNDFEAGEFRSNHRKYVVIARETIKKNAEASQRRAVDGDHAELPPLLVILVTKNSPSYQDFAYGIQGRLRALAVDLVPECEWIGKVKTLIQPIPQLRKAAKFWHELNLAFINSWASRRLGFLAKAETAVSEHKAIDVDIEIECPVLRIPVGEGSILVLDLGRANLKTEKLAGVADARFLGSLADQTPRKKTSMTGNGTIETGSKDDASWRTPVHATRRRDTLVESSRGELGTGMRTDFSVRLNCGGSVDFGHTSRLADSVLDMGPFGENIILLGPGAIESSDSKLEALFYDTYEVHFQIRGIRIESPSNSIAELLDGIAVRSTIHRSIIPADHTLCRYKAFLAVDDFSLEFSKTQILLLGAAAVQWASIASVSSIVQGFDDDMPPESEFSLIGSLSPVIAAAGSHNASSSVSDFDEIEFFDATEVESVSDEISVLIDDNWMVDSDSVLGSESRSKSPSVRRRRRRQSSASDVSSISEGSVVRRRLHFQEGEHLTAENLARLEEEEDLDDTVESEADSFQSAISLDHLIALLRDLEKDIVEAHDRIADKKTRLANLRQPFGSGDSQDSISDSQRDISRKSLRVDLERSTVELKALQAARFDILSQIDGVNASMGLENGSGFDRDRSANSVRRVKALIQSVKKFNTKDETAGAEHNMTRDLKRELFQISVVFSCVTFRLLELDRSNNEALDFTTGVVDTCSLCISNTTAVLRHRIGETKLYSSIDSIACFLENDSKPDERLHYFFVAGAQNPLTRHLFTARFPEFDYPSAEEKFLKVAFALRQGVSSADSQWPFRVAKLRLNIGEIECTPKVPSILMLRATILSILNDLASNVDLRTKRESRPVVQARSASQLSKYYDVAFRFTSVRLVLHEANEPVAALLLTDIGSRIVGSLAGLLYKDRVRGDVRCTNIQVVYLSESGRAVEVLGKHDIYCPTLFRVRARLQSVPVDCTGGWVLEQAGYVEPATIPLGSLGDRRVHDSRAWNCHIGIKVDGVRALVITSAVQRVNGSIVSLLNSARVTSFLVSTPVTSHKIPTIGLYGLPVRWRADLSMKELSVAFKSYETEHDDAGPSHSIEVALSFIASVQLSVALREGIVLNGSVKNFRMTRASDQWTILKPTSIAVFIEVAVKNRFCSTLESPQLLLPDDFPWEQWSASPTNRGGEPISSSDVPQESFVLEMSPMELEVPASAGVSLVEMVRSLILSVSKPNSPKDDEHRPSNLSPRESPWRRRRFQVVLDRASLSLFHERPTESISKLPISLASLTLQNVEVSSLQTGESISFQGVVANVSVIDFSCKSGVQCLVIELCRSETEARSALVISCMLGKAGGRYRANADLSLGSTQCLVLPSLVKSLLQFKSDMKTTQAFIGATSDRPIAEKSGNKLSAIATRLAVLKVCLRVESFELILSSRDMPKYMGTHCNEPIGVVTLRLTVDICGSFRTMLLDGEMTDLSEFAIGSNDRDAVERVSLEYLKPRFTRGHSSRTVVLAEIDLSVQEFQALRTAVAKSESQPHCFFVFPPAAGEQRITNAFDFSAKYRSAVAFFPTSGLNELGSGVCIAHSIQLHSEFVDVLVYISPSAGGMSDAMRVTIQPIVDLLQKERGKSTLPEKPRTLSKGIKDLVLEASATVAIRVDGLKVTFVPGGATRLTESPIIKFELVRVALGSAGVPVKTDDKLLSETTFETLASVAGLSVHHLVSGAWLICEVSASYHNRRLVAWEPFIEPWTLEVRVGMDLVRAIDFRPIHCFTEFQDTSDFSAASATTPLEAGSLRLRDIGRLLRSPFTTDRVAQKEGPGDHPGVLETEIDFCYLLLSCCARESISLALFAPSSPSSENTPLSVLPGLTPMPWLHRFGFPELKEIDANGSTPTPALVCWLSDYAPLNINLTGALIENLSEYSGVKTRRLAPHWIRNESGLAIRFQEVLDNDRIDGREKAKKVIIGNGSQAPLSLKRSLSQSCDPHRAHVMLELGNFEETVGRIGLGDLEVSRGSRSSMFSYRVTAKVAVDTVGVHRYPLDWNVGRRPDFKSTSRQSGQRALGWIIVRVALSDGVKMVSVESPLILKNTSDIDLLCEVRDYGGLSLLWRCVVKKEPGQGKGSYFSVPADIVPSIHGRSHFFGVAALPRNCAFEHEAEVPPVDGRKVTRISPPPPYSPSSFGKGIIDESHISVQVLENGLPNTRNIAAPGTELLHLDLCALRIGSFSLDQSKGQQQSKAKPLVPEQRMLVFRSSLTVQNYLALPVQVQVRVHDDVARFGEARECKTSFDDSQGWTDLGVLGCSEESRWAGAKPSDEIEIRIRVSGRDGGLSRQFPKWSSPVTIPSDSPNGDDQMRGPPKLAKLKVLDSSNVPLLLSVALNPDESRPDHASSFDSIKQFAAKLPAASRVVSLYCPFWIVDSTGLDLQYKSRNFVAGQVDAGLASRRDGNGNGNGKWPEATSTLGLGELLDDSDLTYLPSRVMFQVLMIGDEGATQLQIRRRLTREETTVGSLSPWSDPVPLMVENQAYHDISVLPPPRILASGKKILGATDVEEPFALRSRLLRAPEALGGSHGTRLVHVVCRYAVINELGREIEICGSGSRRAPVSIFADGRPRPFHFDDSGPIRFRPKEFGWLWSGKFNVQRSRREMNLRLKHKLKGHTLIVSVEFHSKNPAGTCVIVLRTATHAPYRIENHTMYPIQYRQIPQLLERILSRSAASSSKETVILPYHHAEFAWDEPEYGRRLVSLQLAEFGDLLHHMSRSHLGFFRIDNLVPGAELELPVSRLVGKVIADGPTRVLRISECSAPDAIRKRDIDDFERLEDSSSAMSVMISVRLPHGLGVSIVDWHPQELLYIRMNDISFVHNRNRKKEAVKLSIGSIMVDNQLWVTPYPVTLRMGSASTRRRNKRQIALLLLWSQLHTTQSRFGEFTLIENASLSTVPSVISVDGNLAAYALEMARHMKEIGSKTDTVERVTRNDQLRRALSIGSSNDCDDEAQRTSRSCKSIVTDDLYSAVDYGMATGAIAAKLRSRYRPPDLAGRSRKGDATLDDAMFDLLSKPRHKIYIERLRVSTTTAEISWSGFLPISSSLPWLLRPALTFEGLPLLLRPYSSSHAFGSADEHLQAIKAHYFSIWRILDLVVGVMMKPTFIARAVVFTSRESCASAFASVAHVLTSTDKSLEALVPKAWKEETNLPFIESLCRMLVGPIVRYNCSLLGCLSKFAAASSALLRYDAARHRASGGLVRSRNPRLFANIDGNDLLVEYVEGENAGKALLSRVRMGAHLGEGYAYHVEGACLLKTRPRSESDMDVSPLILMLTFDRVLLLHGELDAEFCDVVWEAPFADIIYAEHILMPDGSYTQVLLWHLFEGPRSQEERYAKSVVSDTGGLETLHCKCIFVPLVTVNTLLSKMSLVKSTLLDRSSLP